MIAPRVPRLVGLAQLCRPGNQLDTLGTDRHHDRAVHRGFRDVAAPTVTTTLCTVAAGRAAHAARHDPPPVRLVGAGRSR